MTGAVSVLCGVGHWLPPQVVSNADLCTRLGTTEEWILQRTGIRARHVAGPDLSTADIATAAGARALASSGDPEVQAVVLATSTPDRVCPATAPEVASRLGLIEAAAFDVAAVCTGFLYGLAAGTGLIAAGHADRVLVIAADRFTTLLDPVDRTTVPIFGDGGGAVVLRRGSATELGALGRILLGSDGAQADLIAVADDGYFRMQGRAVFRQAVERIADTSRRAAAAAGWKVGQVDRLIVHQANARILAAVAAELELSAERSMQNIENVGNTAGASIPLLLGELTQRRALVPGNRVLLAAFGGGLTWGATGMTWPKLKAIP